MDQLAIAVNKDEIVALGRKFFPTNYEKDKIQYAENAFSQELNYFRIFKVHEKQFYLAVCYDTFGIKHKNIL